MISVFRKVFVFILTFFDYPGGSESARFGGAWRKNHLLHEEQHGFS